MLKDISQIENLNVRLKAKFESPTFSNAVLQTDIISLGCEA